MNEDIDNAAGDAWNNRYHEAILEARSAMENDGR